MTDLGLPVTECGALCNFFKKNANSSLRESCTSYQKAVLLHRFRKQSIYEATQITNWRVLSPLWSDHKDTATL